MSDKSEFDYIMNIILATSKEDERSAIIDGLDKSDLNCRIHCPESISDLDKISADNQVDLIITELEFQNGSLVDWLILWPYPFIILASPDSGDKINSVLSDEASSFIIRREDLAHIGFLPAMIKKVLNIKESRKTQNNFLKNSEKQYMNLVQTLPDIIYVLDSNGNFTFLNNAVRNLGWEPVELIGKHFSELLYSDEMKKVARDSILPGLRGKITGNDRAPKLFDERRTGNRMTRGLNIRLKRKPSIGGFIDVSLTSYGEISSIGYAGFQTNIQQELGTAGVIRERKESAYSKSNSDNAESIFEIEGALTHDAVMHLINNKLQVLSSLVSLKQSLCSDPLACSSLNEVQIQVYTLSLVYQNLVTSNSKIKVNMESYLDDILKHLVSSYAGNPWVQQIDLYCDSILLDEDPAITISLFINEIITVFLKIEENIDNGKVPLTITFLINEGIAQLKIRASEKIFNIYNETMKDESSEIIIKTLAEIIKGEIFTDKDSLTLFFNIE